MFILVAGMMEDQADLISFSSEKGLMRAVHQYRNEGETLSTSNPDRQINHQEPEDDSGAGPTLFIMEHF